MLLGGWLFQSGSQFELVGNTSTSLAEVAQRNTPNLPTNIVPTNIA